MTNTEIKLNNNKTYAIGRDVLIDTTTKTITVKKPMFQKELELCLLNAFSCVDLICEASPMYVSINLEDEAVMWWQAGWHLAEESMKFVGKQIAVKPSDKTQFWRHQGCCPQCGESGRLDLCGGANCSAHGFYQLEIV